MLKVCKHCHKSFKLVNGCGKYCSLECYHNSLNTINNDIRHRICKQCNKPFISTQKSTKQILSNNFCCKGCRYKYQALKQKTGIIKTCKQCNKPFYAKKCNINYNFCCSDCWYEYRKNNYNINCSISRASLISTGKFNPKRNYYKQGWILNNSNKKMEYYASSYEKLRMEQLNKSNIKWTKNHGIRIPYRDKFGNIRNYVPDILINDNILEEIKPQKLVNSAFDNNCYKIKAGFEYCEHRGLTYRIITEEDLI